MRKIFIASDHAGFDLKEMIKKYLSKKRLTFQDLGPENDKFWHDYKGASINSINNSICIKKSDIVIIKFGEKYKQWNAAFDAGYAIGLNKNIITLHLSDDELISRRKKWKKQPIKVTKGSLFKYANVVSSASLGCITDEFN